MLLRVFRIATVDQTAIGRVLQIDTPDFEDSVTAVAAELAGCDLIVTRDPKGFRESPVRALRRKLPPVSFFADCDSTFALKTDI
jgi:hypothetical protein